MRIDQILTERKKIKTHRLIYIWEQTWLCDKSGRGTSHDWTISNSVIGERWLQGLTKGNSLNRNI